MGERERRRIQRENWKTIESKQVNEGIEVLREGRYGDETRNLHSRMLDRSTTIKKKCESECGLRSFPYYAMKRGEANFVEDTNYNSIGHYEQSNTLICKCMTLKHKPKIVSGDKCDRLCNGPNLDSNNRPVKS